MKANTQIQSNLSTHRQSGTKKVFNFFYSNKAIKFFNLNKY